VRALVTSALTLDLVAEGGGDDVGGVGGDVDCDVGDVGGDVAVDVDVDVDVGVGVGVGFDVDVDDDVNVDVDDVSGALGHVNEQAG